MNDSIIKAIGRSYIVSSLIPSILAVLLATVIFRDFFPALNNPDQDTFLYFESFAGLLISFTLWLAFALYSAQDPIVKLFEGYFFLGLPSLNRKLYRTNKDIQTRVERLEELTEKHHKLSAYENFPQSRLNKLFDEVGNLREAALQEIQEQELRAPLDVSNLLPTELGNALRASEIYARERYGIDGLSLWPRLSHVLPGEFMTNLEEQNNRLMFLLNSSLLALVLSTACFVVTIANVANWISQTTSARNFLILGLLLAVVGYVIYRASVSTAIDFGTFIRSGYDLYRFDLLVQLNQCLPNDLAEEEDIWDKLRQFFAAGHRLGQLHFDYNFNKSLKEKGEQCESDEEE